jgi:hypothetical protein
MTKGQQIILAIVIVMLFGVMGLLAITLINSNQAASSVPTLAILPTATATRLVDTPTPISVPPTWTPAPTRAPPPTNTPRPTHTATAPPTISPTFAPTFTPRPTKVVTAGPPGPTGTLGLQNPGFEGIGGGTIPGWSWWAEDNFTPGGDYNPDASFDTPLFKQADDPVRFIDGPTLQVDAEEHLKFKVHIFQTVTVSPTAGVRFQVLGGAFSDIGIVQMAAGIDPDGGPDCSNAQWSDAVAVDQEQGVRSIAAPPVVAGRSGRVTVCLYAEPLYAAISNAAFFDDAELTVTLE